jgi:DNA-binding XRE family transcriptional regulator
MGGKTWTKTDIGTLCKLYPGEHWNKIKAALPGRTRASIQVKAIELRIKRHRDGKTPWTGPEKATLRELWPSAPWKTILAALPRHPKPAIAKMGSTLGVRRDTARRSPYPIIRELRRARQEAMEQDILAEILGTHRVQIAKWERGEVVPRLRMFFDWVEALGYQLRLDRVDR